MALRSSSLRSLMKWVGGLDQHVMAPAPDALVLSNETLRPSEAVDLILARLAEQ